MADWSLPRIRASSTAAVWRRNLLVWRKLIAPALVVNFGEPFLYLLGLGYGFGLYIGQMAGMPYLTFLASGIVASASMNTASFEGMYSVHTRMVPQQTYAAMMATPVTVDDIVAGELLWCASKALLSGVAMICVAALLGAVHGWGVLLAVPCVFLTGLCFTGPALVMSALAPNYDFFNYYATLVLAPLLLLCGVFYPINTFPEPLQAGVAFLPLTHAVELIRPLLAGRALTAAWLHVSVLLAYAFIGYYAAVVLVRRRLLV